MTQTTPVKSILVALALVLLLALAACSSPAPAGDNTAPMDEGAGEQMMDDDMKTGETAGDDMTGEKMMDGEMAGDDEMKTGEMAGDDMMDDDTAGDEMTDDGMTDDDPTNDGMTNDDMTSALPLWQTLPLMDARSGETFTLAGFQGRRVFVEPMATWCTNCRQQLENVREAQASAPDDAVFVALSVETTLSAAQLAQYADAAGFDWTFAVMTPELLQALVDEFGRTISNPPATPHFLIAGDGSWSEVVTGIDSPQALLAQLEALP